MDEFIILSRQDLRADARAATICGSVFRHLLRRIKSEEMGNALALFAPARKYQLDLARALIHQGDLLLDDDIAEPAQLWRQSLRFGG
jgi:hypothetical protein